MATSSGPTGGCIGVEALSMDIVFSPVIFGALSPGHHEIAKPIHFNLRIAHIAAKVYGVVFCCPIGVVLSHSQIVSQRWIGRIAATNIGNGEVAGVIHCNAWGMTVNLLVNGELRAYRRAVGVVCATANVPINKMAVGSMPTAFPRNYIITTIVHGDIGLDLTARRVGIYLEFIAKWSARGIVVPRVNVRVFAVWAAPGDHEVAGRVHCDGGVGLDAGRSVVNPKLATQRLAVGGKTPPVDLAPIIFLPLTFPDNHKIAAGTYGHVRIHLIVGRVNVDLMFGQADLTRANNRKNRQNTPRSKLEH